MNLSTRITLCFFSTLATISAQNPVAFPQDSTSTSSGNLVPLGFSSSGAYDEGRYQQLIPATHLPSTAALVTGMAVFTIPGTGAVTYKSLKITLAHTTRTSLDSTFANNLTGPIAVFDQQNVVVTYQQAQWVALTFTGLFVYDGARNLVVDIQKVLDSTAQTQGIVSHGTSSNPGRQDLPRSSYVFGTYGSGVAATATTASYASSTFKLRLLVAGETLTVKSDRLASGNVFALGGSIDFTNYGTPGHRFANLLSVGFTPTPIPLFGGLIYLSTPSVFLNSGSIPNSGSNVLNATIPNLPSLVGVQGVVQGVSADASGGGTRVTCAVDFLVNN